MSRQETQRDAIVLVGIQTQASNDRADLLGAHWQRFYAEDVAGQIPDRLGDETFAVYCEYEGDHTKPYTFFLGCPVAPSASPPEGLVRREVPGGTFACIVSEGTQPMALVDSWTHIWETELTRRFEADYEIHRADSPDRIEIYVGV